MNPFEEKQSARIPRFRIRQRVVHSCTKEEEKSDMARQKGFTLIELLIVVAIILIIAAIAIPNLLRARMAANESSAVGSTRTINTAEVTYNSTFPTVGFTSILANLGGTASPCIYLCCISQSSHMRYLAITVLATTFLHAQTQTPPSQSSPPK